MLGRFERNKDLIDQNQLKDVSVIGCGGIGSALAVQMGIMGWERVMFWDDDMLEEHNLSTTTYPAEHLGNSKSNAALNMLQLFGTRQQMDTSRAYLAKLEPNTSQTITKNVFVCTESMISRRDTYDKWCSNKDRGFFVDMRMGALSVNVSTATKENDDYMGTWYDDTEVEDEPCTAKHTIFCAQFAASLGMTQAFSVLRKIPYYSYITYSLSPSKLDAWHDKLILPK